MSSKRYPSRLESIPDYGGSLGNPSVTCVGSAVYTASGKLGNCTENLTDGSLLTEWTPFAPEATQTILCDLGAVKPLCGMNVVPGKQSAPFHIRIEGSADGEDWTLLADTKTGGRNVCRGARFDGRPVLSEKLSGEYRFVKLLVFGVSDKSVKKTIAALEVYAEDPAETEPPAPGTTSQAQPRAEMGEAQAEGARSGGNLLKTAVPVLAGILLCAGAAALLFGKRRKKG